MPVNRPLSKYGMPDQPGRAPSPLPDMDNLVGSVVDNDEPLPDNPMFNDVRHLLRTSQFGSIPNSPTTPVWRNRGNGDHEATISVMPMSQEPSPIRLPEPAYQPKPINSPRRVISSSKSSTIVESPSSIRSKATSDDSSKRSVQLPRMDYQGAAHRSGLFNARAFTALDHPDLTDPSLGFHSQQKRQHREHHGYRKHRERREHRGTRRPKPSPAKKPHPIKRASAVAQTVICTFAALLLSALVATYLALATTSSGISTTFHVLFIIGIIMATILFAHSLVRLILVSGRRYRPRPLWVDAEEAGLYRHRHRPGHSQRHPQPRSQPREMPSVSGDLEAFVPPTPIRVHIPSDEVRDDSNIAHPTIVETEEESWAKEVRTGVNPPPAYGRWRGSVLANPDLLHWQPVSSPTIAHTPALPSPAYDEAMAAWQNLSPPSYVTKDSPARQRAIQKMQAEAVHMQAVEPEMIEVRGIGVGRAV